MPINLQAKLLRVLEAREVRRVGDSKIIPIDVRVISATNINIKEKIAEGKFRSDLYYRLNLLDINVAPLRERKEDIPILAEKFIKNSSMKIRNEFITVTQGAYDALKELPWDGNVRELKNICERLVVLCETGVITIGDVEALNLEKNEFKNNNYNAVPKKTLEQEAAELGISRTTLWRRKKNKKL